MQAQHPLAYLLADKKKDDFLLSCVPQEVVIKHPPRSYCWNKMGCLILAGGQGTRLGWNGPKGCMPLPLPGRPTLLQKLLESIKAKKEDLPVAIMTSPLNHVATENYLQAHRFFGLKCVALFEQETLAVSDRRGFIVYQTKEDPVTAPTGNGQALHHFYRSKLWHAWRAQNIELVQVIFIDNVLSRPFDEELLGIYEKQKCDLVLRFVERKNLTEKIGVIGLRNKRLAVKEYTELSPEVNRKQKGRWDFPFGNTGIFACSMDWIQRVQKVVLPWHLAFKAGKGNIFAGGKWEQVAEVVKFETFLFDLFAYADSFALLKSDRKRHFAPLKSHQDVARLLQLLS